MKQQTLAVAADQTFESYRKPTRRDEFLKTMEAIVPWTALCDVIEPQAWYLSGVFKISSHVEGNLHIN